MIMRAKILFPCLLLLVFSLVLILAHQQTPPVRLAAGETRTATMTKPVARMPAAVPPQAQGQPLEMEQSSFASSEPEPAVRAARLAELGMSADLPALSEILPALTDPDAEVRAAARDAAVQFGSRDAIPWLQAAIPQTDDIHEKAAIQSAIDCLELPALAEVASQP
jgi:hypothetical protein